MPGKIIQILFFLTVNLHASAQLCTGTLGNPVIDINFGFGPNPGSPLPQIPANYQYSNQDCPQQGFYALRTSTSFCFNSAWLIVPSDHTHTNPDGYFLIVNAKPGISDIYIDTIKGLCPNTTFQVSTWIMNLANRSCSDIDPKVVFTITDLSGSVITQYTTKSIGKTTAFDWKQYSFQFPGSATGNIILKVSENAHGCSTGLAIDDITMRPCAGTIRAIFSNSSTSNIQTCENQQSNYVLSANYSGLNNPSIQWQMSSDGNSWNDLTGATGNTFTRTPTKGGFFYYRFFITENNNTSCVYYSNIASVEVQSIFAQATNYVFGCYGAPIELFAAGGSNYEWTGPDNFSSNSEGPVIPKVNFNNTGAYVVKVMTTAGCFAYDTTNLVIYAAPIANASPPQSFLCEGDSIQLFSNGSIRYKWEPSDGLSNDTIANPIAKPKETTTYIVKVFNEHTCYDTASVKIVVWKRPSADAGPDKFTFKNRAVMLQGRTSGSDISYSWSPPVYLDNTSIERPKASPPSTMTYTLTVISNDGCGTAIDNVNVEVIDKMFIPSAFTPNNDGLNDVWEIITFEEYPNGTVQVFNRWGQIIYFSKGLNYKPWDGTCNGSLVATGTYVYVIDLHNNKKILKGTVTVIR